MSTLLISHPACIDHEVPAGHPERPDRMPATVEDLGEHFSRLGELRELIKIRDDARRHIGRPGPGDDASEEVSA